MIVPVDGHWLNLMMGKRFHENLNSNSENDSTSSYESAKTCERDDQPSPPICTSTESKSDTKDHLEKLSEVLSESNEAKSTCETAETDRLLKLDQIPKDDTINTHSTKIATMNLEVSKLSTKNIIEHSKIMSLQHVERVPVNLIPEESSGDETSSRGTLDAIIPPLKDFQGKNNPFLMNSYSSKPFANMNAYNRQNGRLNSRFSLPNQLNPLFGPVVRPMKRKLSEKDIVIGPNGEVKRRKYRRPKKHLQLQVWPH